jgi:putative ABC transport system permease protein
MLHAISTSLRAGFRLHRRQPAFALTVVSTLALTIGATTAVVSVANAMLLRALPYASPDELVWIGSVRADNPDAPFSLPEFLDYSRQNRSLSGLAAYANWSASLAGAEITERLQGARMSANAFAVLGIAPAAGRLLTPADDHPDAPAVVVLSHRLWQRKYDGAADIIGRSVRINGQSFVVVGVAPVHFPLPLRDIDVMTPLAPARDPLRLERNSVNFLRLFGRLGPGVNLDAAQAELTAICGSLREQFPDAYARKQSVRVVPLHDALVADHRQSVLLLTAAVLVVLAAAVANLVSLALVRGNERRVEVSLRMALGASHSRLARQHVGEALFLTVAGSGLGWVLAVQAIAVASRLAPASTPRLDEVSIDRTTVFLAICVTTLVTAVLAVAPLIGVVRRRAQEMLRPASRGAIGDRQNNRVRTLMVGAEIAAALVLLLAAAVLVDNLRRLHTVDPGFRADNVFQARVSLPPSYRVPGDFTRFYERLSEPLNTSPGVQQSGVISVAPLSGLLAMVPFSVSGESTAERDRATAHIRAISPGYLSTVGTQVLQGRAFASTDRSDTPAVGLVSAALADRFLPGQAIGRQLLIDDNNTGPRPVEIVGVVENVRHVALDAPPAPDIYIPLTQVHPDGLPFLRNNQFWMVRTAADPGTIRTTFLRLLREIDPDAAVSGAGPMQEFVDASLGPRRFTLGLLGAFAFAAVALAVLGLYGLVTYAVGQRVPEIGLRLAIGATPRDVQWMILRQAASIGLTGIAAGLLVVSSLRSLVARMSPAISVSPAMIAIAAAVLFAAVVAAAWVPARRAARIGHTSFRTS